MPSLGQRGRHHRVGALRRQRRPDHSPGIRRPTPEVRQLRLLDLWLPAAPVRSLRVRPAVPSKPRRLVWRSWQVVSPNEALEVDHAWIVEDLDHGAGRVLTHELQVGKPAAELARKRPIPMLLGYQDWLDGLVESRTRKARGRGDC